jgi:hypothetical protein
MKDMTKKILVAFTIGFILEFFMSKLWGYNNDPFTILGVPLFILLTWSVLLPLGYHLRKGFIKKKTNNIIKDAILALGFIFTLEYVGGVIMGIRLSVTDLYPALLPLDVFRAPLWLLVTYIIIVVGYWKLFDSKLLEKY